MHERVVHWVADDGDLTDGWIVKRATVLFRAVTLPSTWRELTEHQGWSADEYVEHFTRLLPRAFIRGG